MATSFMLSPLCMLFGNSIMGDLSDRFGRKRILLISMSGIATADIMAFASMLIFFSNAVATKEQGWVIGISGAVMSTAWVCSGLSANLLTYLSAAQHSSLQ